MLRRSFIIALALGALGVAASCRGRDTRQQEADPLATLLNWHRGDVVAEIGAGSSKLTLLAAQRVGPSGKVYTTELDPKALAHLKELAAKEKNIVAVKAARTDTNLPAGCCDSIFSRQNAVGGSQQARGWGLGGRVEVRQFPRVDFQKAVGRERVSMTAPV